MQKSSSDVSSAAKPQRVALVDGKFIVMAVGSQAAADVYIFTASGWHRPLPDRPAALLSSSGACEIRDNAKNNTLNKDYQFHIVQVKE